MNRIVRWIALFITMGCASFGRAQTIQLPTVKQFRVGTSVVVPDRGAAWLGGVQRAGYQSSSSGIPGVSGLPGLGRLTRNTSRSSELSSTGASVTATIIDLDELDRQVLSAARGEAPPNPQQAALARRAAFLSRHTVRIPRSGPSSTRSQVARSAVSSLPTR